MNQISLCMIVKNEEENIKRCLENIKEYVDEIVIVDTGSTDKTKDILSEFTNKIYDFKWCNDFSKARNFSIEKASNDWILVLDADEIVKSFNKNLVIDSIKNNEQVVGRIKRINILEDEMGSKRYIERVNRLFNKKYHNYQGMIHEQIVDKCGKEYKTINIDISADHIGYTKDVIKKTNKIERNLNLLKESIKQNGKDPYLYYQIGKTYHMDKKDEQAYENFCKALSFEINIKYEYVQDLIITYGYSLINTRRYKKALELEKYEHYYNDKIDYKFVMGLIYMNNGLFEESVNQFLSCIGEKEGQIEGINSYLSYYNVGIIYECLGFKEEAVDYYRKCGTYNLALKRLESLIS